MAAAASRRGKHLKPTRKMQGWHRNDADDGEKSSIRSGIGVGGTAPGGARTMVDERGSLSWGQTIETVRGMRRWTQARLAREAEVSVSSLSEYERGNLEPPEDAQARIEAALGLGGWIELARAVLGQMLMAAEGGSGAADLEGVFAEAARTTTTRTELALRAGLERLRQVREKKTQEASPAGSATGGRESPLQRESPRARKA
jgi:transcriptional regulator with XRE-family HTH domain